MADAVVNVSVKLDAQEALHNVSTFTEGVKNKITEVDDAIQKTNSNLSDIWSSDEYFNNNPSSIKATNIVSTAKDALSEIKKGFEEVGSLASSGRFSDGMVKMFDSFYRTMSSSMQKIADYSTNFEKSINASYKKDRPIPFSKFIGNQREQELRLASASGLQAAAEAKALAKYIADNTASGGFGIHGHELESFLPAVRQFTEKRLSNVQRTLKGTGSIDDLVRIVAQDQAYQKALSGAAGGRKFSNAQAQNIARLFALGSRLGSAGNRAQYLENAGFEEELKLFQTDYFPKTYQAAFRNYGYSNKERQYNPSAGFRAGEKEYKALRNLVSGGNEQAIQLAKRVGLLRARDGSYEFSGGASRAQMETLAGLAMQGIRDAKTSLPYYYVDANDISKEETLIRRQNKAYNGYMEIVNSLAKHGVFPNVYSGGKGHRVDETVDEIIRGNDLFAFQETGMQKYNRRQLRINSMGNKDMFVVPQTYIGEDGELVVRDPNWKKTNGVKATKDDHFVTIGRSAFTDLLGYHGNNTFGYGRDIEGKAIYDTPKILRLNTSGLYGEVEDPETGKRKIGIKPDKQALANEYNRLFNRETTKTYNGKEYIAAYADEENLIMMLKDEYDTINKQFAGEFLESPFENMNVRGRFGKGSYSGAMKAIDLQRKMATPGHRYDELGYSDVPMAALVDFSTLSKYAGVPETNKILRKNDLIDGISYFDPSVLPFNAQMRIGFIDKFMGQRENWRKLLMGSGLLDQAYASNQNRGLIDINDRNRMSGFKTGYSFYVPQVGLADAITKDNPIEGFTSLDQMIDEMNRLAASGSNPAELQRLRSTYFFDIMNPAYKALLTDTSIKNDDKWRVMRRKNFEGMFPGQTPAYIQSRTEGNPEEDIVALTAAQQAEHARRAARASGVWINNTASDFSTDKDFIPESLATAMGLGIEERTKSSVAYNEYINSLRKDENARRDYLNSMSVGRMLVAAGQENSPLAERLIASRIADMESKRANGHLYMPGAGPEIHLTGAMPGSVAGPLFRGLFGATADENNKYGRLFKYNQDGDNVLMRTLSESDRAAMSRNALAARMMLSRMPAAPGEYAPDAKNIGDFKVIQRAMDALGMEYDDTIYTNPDLQFRLMTGDYDGDTAWVVRGLSANATEKMAEYVRRKNEAAQKISERLGGKDQKLEERDYNPATQFTDSQIGALQAKVDMGTTTAAIRNAMVGMDDNDPNKWITIAQAINEYDLATSETKKKGAILNMNKSTADAARQGALFRRFVKQINAFGDESQEANPRIFSSRLPLLSETSELADMAFNFVARRNGEAVGDVFGSHLDEWLRNTYGDMNTYEAQAASQYASMMKNITSGRRLNNKNDIDAARDLAFNWSKDLEIRRRAGDDVREEEGNLNSYLYRLNSLEKEGATFENITNKRNSLISQQKVLQQQGNVEGAKQLQGLIDVYGQLLTPFSDRMAEVDKVWNEEQQALDDQVKERVAKANAQAAASGIDTSKNQGLINRAFMRNPEAQAKMNWSDVTPWLYQVMEEDREKGKRFALTGVRETNLKTGNQTILPGDETFNPYPHTDSGIDEQRVKIMARELGKGLGIIPDFETTGATVMGTIRHESFEEYLKQRMSGKSAKDVDISSIYAAALSSNGYDGLDLNVEQAADGSYVLKGLDARGLGEGVANALGNFDPASAKFTGGTLQAFANNVIENALSNGGRIANIEAKNYEYDQNGNIRVMNSQEISGRGAKISFPTSYKNAYGYTVQKDGTFAPDLILADKNNNFDMYDYKSGQAGAMDALFQMMVYAKDIQNKANAWRNIQNPQEAAREREKINKLGWGQYVDDQGNLKMSAFHAFDTSTGNMYTLDADQKTIDKMYDYYLRAQEAKMDSARSGEYITRGGAYLQQELDAQSGVVRKEGPARSLENVIYSSQNMQGPDSYRSFLAQKFANDEETLKQINGNIFKQNRRFNNMDFGGYSQFSADLKTLDEMIDPDVLERLRKQMGNDPDATKAIMDFETRVRAARQNITANERMAAVQSFDDIRSSMRQTLFGTKESGALGALASIQKQIDNAEAIREGMKLNPDQFDKTSQTWVSPAAEKAYKDSIEEQKRIEEEVDQMLPALTKRQIKANQKSFDKLLPEEKDGTLEEKLSEFYEKRFDNVEQYVKQQDSYIDEYKKALSKKNKDGSYYYAEGSEKRNAITELLNDAIQKRNDASDLLTNGVSIDSAARKDYEASIGFYQSNKKKRLSERQEEYARFIQDELVNKLSSQMEEAMANGDSEKVSKIAEEIQNVERFGMPRSRELLAQAAVTREIEDRQAQIDKAKIESLYSGNQLSRDDQISEMVNRAALQRERYIQDQVESFGKDNAWAEEFRRTHSDEELRRFYQNRFTQQDAVRQANYAYQDQMQALNQQITERGLARNYEQFLNQRSARSLQATALGRALYSRQQFARNLGYQAQGYQDKIAQRQAEIARLEASKQGANPEQIADIDQKIKAANQDIADYNKNIQTLNQQSTELTSTQSSLGAVFDTLDESAQRVMQRLGRQVFQKALQETKKFVKEFDASMNEIQAITMKSDEDMATVRSQTISKALGLKTSVSNVASTEAALYRQGLSDEEVSSRTDSIIQFATVAKLKVEDATKIITTALQNDMVNSAEEAMDALVALGDNAATTAAEIGKGMQKAAASAKVAGVSYAELTALLTMGTSDTQLSGTQVGTALQTVFTRMRRLSLTGYAADQNGEKTTASDAEAALASVGVDLWDDKATGKMKSAYNVLLDISKVWQTLNDAQKSVVTNALAGTRQTNIFSTLMEGMSEDNGETLEKYLGLAEDSEGITQSKYEIAMQSLEASLNEFRSSWDAVVESLVNTGGITGAIDVVSGFLQGIANVANNGGQVGVGLSAIAGGIAAIFTSIKLFSMGSLPGALITILSLGAGLLAGGVGIGITGGLTSLFKGGETESQKIEREYQEFRNTAAGNQKGREEIISAKENQISKVEKLGEAWEKVKDSQNEIAKVTAQNNLAQGLEDLAAAFPDLSEKIMQSVTDIGTWKNAIEEAKKAAQDLTDQSRSATELDTTSGWDQYAESRYNTAVGELQKKRSLPEAVLRYLEGTVETFGEEAGANNASNAVDFRRLFSMSTKEEREAILNLVGGNNIEVAGALRNNNDLIIDETAVPDDFAAAAFKTLLEIYQGNATLSKSDLTSLGYDFVENEMLKDIDFGLYETGRFSSEDLKTAFTNNLLTAMSANDSAYGFFDEEGKLKTSAVSKFYSDFVKSYNNASDRKAFAERYINSGLTEEDTDYQVNNNGEIFRTNNLDEAVEYAKENNIGYENITTSEGKAAYQSIQDIMEAADLEANKGNKRTALTALAARASEYNNLEELQDYYYNQGLNNEINTALSGYGELRGLEKMVREYGTDYLDFSDALTSTAEGKNIESDLVDLVAQAASETSNFVEDLRTDEILNPLYELFKSYYGDYAEEILTGLDSGTLSPELQKYMEQVNASKRLKGTGTRTFLRQELATMTSELLNSGLSWTEAQNAGFNGWTKDEFDAISQYSDIATLLGMTPEQQASPEGQRIRRTIEIQIKVEGLSDLEQTGEVLEGTSQIVESLQSENAIKVAETLSEISRSARESGQQTAKLYGGTYSQMNEAAMNILGMSEEEFLMNREGNIRKAQEQLQLSRAAQARTFAEEFRAAQTPEARQQVIDAAQAAGYKQGHDYGTFEYDQSLIKLNRMRYRDLTANARAIAEENDLQAIYQDADYRAKYMTRDYYTPEGRGLSAANAFDIRLGANFNKLYENDQVWKDMVDLGADFDSFTGYISRMAKGQPGNAAQNYGFALQQAFGTADIANLTAEQLQEGWINAGPQLREVLSRAFEQMGGGDTFKSIATRMGGDLTAARDAYNSWLLEQNRFDSLESGMAYQQAQYDISNRTQNAAVSLFDVLSKGQNFDTFGDFINSVDKSQVDNWKALIDSSPELANKLNELGFSFDENTLDFTGEAESFKSALAALAAAVAEASNQITDVTTHGEDLRRAQEYLETGNADYYSAFETVLGSSELAQQARNNIITQSPLADKYFKDYQNASVSERRSIREEAEAQGFTPIFENGRLTRFGLNPTAGFSDYQRDYYNTLWSNAQLGITGLTEEQKLQGANLIQSIIASGGYNDFYKTQNKQMISDYSSMMSQDYLNMAAAVESANVTVGGQRVTMANIGEMIDTGKIKEGDQAYKDLQATLGQVERSVNQAAEASSDFAGELAGKNADAAIKYGKASKNLPTILSMIKKGGKDATQAMAVFKKNLRGYQDQMTAISNASGKSGKELNDQTRNLIASMIEGIDADDVKQMTKEELAKQLDPLAGEINQAVTEDLQALFDESLADKNITAVDLSKIKVNADGTLDTSGVNANVAAAVQQAVSELEAYAGELASIMFSTEGGDGLLKLIATVNANPSGKYGGGGGGGGGGGKSEAQKLIESQKHKIDELQHQYNMVEKQQTHYDNINDFDAYMGSIRDEESAIAALQAQYQTNIAELQQQLAGTEYDSEDYWALIDAINSAEEAMADLQNSLDTIMDKVIDELQERYERETSPDQHIETMLEKRASRYQMLGQFENWASIMEQENEQINDNMIYDLKQQRKDWLKQMDKTEWGGDQWAEIRDIIYGIDEQIADYENQILQNQIEVNEARVTQIGTDLTNANRTAEHNVTISGTAASIYQAHEQHGRYRDELARQNRDYGSQIVDYQEARRQQMIALSEIEKFESDNKLKNHTEAWYAARDAIYSYDEAILSATNAIDENNRAFQQSLVSEQTDRYDDMASDYDHIRKMYETRAEIFKEQGDEASYLKVLSNERNALIKDLYSRSSNLRGLETLANSGTIVDPQAWDELREKIKSAREDVANTELELVKLDKTVRQIEFDNLMEKFNRQDELYQHQIKLEQYNETRYQNNGELTNYGIMLQYERETQTKRAQALRNNLSTLDQQLLKAQAAGDEETYYKITQEIYKEEEALAQVETQIQKINKTLDENQEKIRQVRQTLENEIVKEIRARITKEKNMLSAEINMQNQILNVIKKRYQDEWALIRKDIQQRQNALNEEKRMINERLQAAKNAQNQEDKMEELAEYQRQLALISMDPTRNKDVKDLQRRIEELQKELSWETADQEAAAAQEAIDQQIQALNDYAAATEEDLNEMLSDANNFKYEMDKLLSYDITTEFDQDAFDSYIEYMKTWDKNYQNSSKETRKQMEEGWRQTWLTMQGLAETFWEDEVFLRAFETKEAFMDYMKASDAYRDASESGQQSLLYKWSEMYDNVSRSLLSSASFDDSHELVDFASEGVGYLYDLSDLASKQVENLDYIASMVNSMVNVLDTGWRKPDNTTTADNYLHNNLEQTQSSVESHGKITDDTQSGGGSGSSGGSGDGTGSGTDSSGYRWKYKTTYNGEVMESGYDYTSEKAARDAGDTAVTNRFVAAENRIKAAGYPYNTETTLIATENGYASAAKRNMGAFFQKYLYGGLVDYTGPAWVDGSPTKPEAFLDAYDTETIRQLVDSLNYVRVDSGFVPDASMFTNNSSSFGDINIIINQAELKSDADYEEVARKVGQAFTRQMSRNGLNLTGYSF